MHRIDTTASSKCIFHINGIALEWAQSGGSGPRTAPVTCDRPAHQSAPSRARIPGAIPGQRGDPMQFEYTPKVKEMQARLLAFFDEHIYPNEKRFYAEIAANRQAGNAW